MRELRRTKQFPPPIAEVLEILEAKTDEWGRMKMVNPQSIEEQRKLLSEAIEEAQEKLGKPATIDEGGRA